MSDTPSPFPSNTAWSIVLGARDLRSPRRQEWLDRLILTYWKPVYWFLIRRWNVKPDDASDLTQEFFLRLYEGDFLKDASPDRGRFRTFLKLKLRDLVVDDLRRRTAQKRGGTAQIVPIGQTGPEPSWTGLGPDEAFDRDWMQCLTAEAIHELETLMTADGKGIAFQAFARCVLMTPQKSYRDCAAELSVKESDVRNYVFRARSELQSLVRRMVRESVEHDDLVDEEYAYLMRLFER
ncbi:MAG: sigma-70 family RNA polymerase sigma factor [Planctomycetes bacterium]|nr:sigma-70 family RNA polymerase sigma factor [Planctomycetota bacterium]